MGKIIVMDFDDVLVRHSEETFRCIMRNFKKYSPYLKNLGQLTTEEIYNRDKFLMQEWLIRDELKDLDEKKKMEINNIVFSFLKRDVFDKDVYSYLEPSIFARKTLMNPLFIENPQIEKIIILSRNVSDLMEKYKKDFVKRHFPNNKIEIMFVNGNEKKSAILNGLKCGWDMMVDDEIKNIKEISENSNIEKKEFLIPKYGYNEMPLDLSLLIKGKGGVFTYYDEIKE